MISIWYLIGDHSFSFLTACFIFFHFRRLTFLLCLLQLPLYLVLVLGHGSRSVSEISEPF